MKKKTGKWIIFQILLLLLIITGCTQPASGGEKHSSGSQNSPSNEQTASGDVIADFPLAADGDYAVGIRRNITYKDPGRDGKEIKITIWYPAVAADAQTGKENPDASPDMSAAPYPLILSSSKLGFIFAESLVSHGFVYIGVNRIDTYKNLDENTIDQPLDILFALKMVADAPPDWLAGLANTDLAGTLGYSFDGYNSLAMSGARFDPQAYLQHCKDIASSEPAPEEWYLEYLCSIAANWEAFETHAGAEITTSTDSLWQPMTDARITAVMPMSPDGAWLFNERGLAAVDRPTFLVCAENEEFYAKDEMRFLFDHLGTDEKYLVTFLNRDHMMILEQSTVAQLAHFANAFFGYYLKGLADYKQYFSQEFVSQQSDLAWGVYTGK